MASIIGRESELRVGDAFATAVARGPALLWLEGEAGIGKTTLWAEIAHRVESRGAMVLRSQPTAAEKSLTLSALGDLLEAVPEAALGALPDVQRHAIDAALMRVEPSGAGLEQRLLGAATRSVLLALAMERPLVIAVDDVQWLDAASAMTLTYAARRIGTARVGILTARRTGLAGPFDVASLPADFARHQVDVGALTLAALHHLLKDRFGEPPARSTLVRIHDATGGHPLFALEMMRLLKEAPEAGPDEPLPVPSTVRELVRQRVRKLPASTRAVLLAAAAHREPTVASVAEAAGRSVATDLEVAERAEVARISLDRIVFSHPLFASAIYAAATDQERRDVHRRLARIVETVEERARHSALATSGVDSEVAADLERAAHVAAARAAPLAAADLLLHALRLTPPNHLDAIDDRKIALGNLLKLGGDAAEAERVLDEAATTASTRRDRARARIALANVLFDLDAGARCSSLALAALEDAADDQELLAHAHAMLSAVDYSDRPRAVRHAREAKRLLAEVPRPAAAVESLVLRVYALAEIQSGNPLPMDVVERALALEQSAPAPVVSDRLSASLGYWLVLVSDDLDGGRRWMEATYEAAVNEGDEGSIPYALSHLPLLEFAAGNWDRAEQVARRHLAAATERGHESQRLEALFNLSNVLAHRGQEAEARPLIGELLRDAEAAGSLWDLTKGLAALGALELSVGNPAEAVRHLGRAEEGRDTLGDDMHRRHEGDMVEALLESGRVDDARALAEKVQSRALRYARHSRLAVAARSRAMVCAASGGLDEAIAALDVALAEHDLAPLPFDRARTELVLGRVRRRRRERTLAKVAFESALASFERVGARIWADRARAELERVGLRRGAGLELTPGERRVAEQVATGMTNREVAAALFVSPKTVEVSLARAYQKLGVRSRAELAALMAAGVAPPRADRATAADVGISRMRRDAAGR